jgi:predicted Rossmann fold flavoprotein
LTETAPVIVVGAGAAGIMAAIFAADAGARVLLLERTRDGGRKILISGGGRCNVLPSELSPSQYITASSPNTLRKMLLSWPLAEQKQFFERSLGIALRLEPETGKLFPVSNRARDVRDALVDVARQRGVQLRFDSTVADVSRDADGWTVLLDGGEVLPAARVILATGGLSVPNTGSDGTGLRIAKRLGHTIHDLYPALTPLTAVPPVHADLAGISLEVTLEAPIPRGSFVTQGGFLFTHRGYSGPSVLDISHLAVQSRSAGMHQAIRVRWTGQDARAWEERLLQPGAASIGALLKRELPARLVEALLAEARVNSDTVLAQLRKEERQRLIDVLARYALPWTGDEGYKKAEVTGGGVALGEVDARTLESKLHKGLFLCGEMLDAFGPIGGYNFAWGWATGRAAGIGAGAA